MRHNSWERTLGYIRANYVEIYSQMSQSNFKILKSVQNSKHEFNVILPSNMINDSMLQGAVSIRKTVLPGMAIPMLKIRRPNGRLIFNMEIAIRR